MGYQVQGTDINPQMVEYSQINLNWLHQQFKSKGTVVDVSIGDATAHNWVSNFAAIAAETFLGRPLSSLPDKQTLQKIVRDCDTIHTKFLKNVARQTEPGFRMCIAVPAWNLKNDVDEWHPQSRQAGTRTLPDQPHRFSKFQHLPVLDSLEKLGYNRIKFVHCEQKDLVYHRPGQVVARELVVLERT